MQHVHNESVQTCLTQSFRLMTAHHPASESRLRHTEFVGDVDHRYTRFLFERRKVCRDRSFFEMIWVPVLSLKIQQSCWGKSCNYRDDTWSTSQSFSKPSFPRWSFMNLQTYGTLQPTEQCQYEANSHEQELLRHRNRSQQLHLCMSMFEM